MSIKNIADFNVESLREFFEKYLSQVIYFICFALILIFFIIFVSNRKEEAKKELMANYYRAVNYLNAGNEEEAIKIFRDISESKNATVDMKSIFNLKMANIFNLQGNVDEAIKIYMKVYNSESSDAFLKNLAGLNALSLMINKGDNEKAIEELIVKLSNPNNPFVTLVSEQEGMFKIQKGNIKEGLEILNNLLKQDIDENAEKRIKSIISMYENI